VGIQPLPPSSDNSWKPGRVEVAGARNHERTSTTIPEGLQKLLVQMLQEALDYERQEGTSADGTKAQSTAPHSELG
jgi:hypothetical protein